MSKNTGTSELINYFDLGVNGDVGIAGSLDINTIANATTDTDTFLVSDTGIIKYRTGAQLLSDIGAAPAVAGGYVPYTGATTNVDLGVYNLTTSAIIANGSGSNSGIVHLESNAIHSLVNGYGSIASGTTNQFNLYQTTGAGVFRGAILSLNSITEFATRTFTLPDADGTLALTSQIPANPVGGTGTTNTLSKFTGSTTIGDSNLINDASGNLGLGLTPNTWTGTGTKAFQFQNGTLSASNTYGTSLTWNAYFNAGDKYITNGVAGRYLIEGNVHRWDTAPSGTAGNAISFTQAMTLTSGGNLILTTGTVTDNGARLQVSASGGYFNVDTNGQIISAQSLDVATAGGRLTGMSSRGALGAIHIEQTTTGANGGYIAFRTSDAGSTTPTEKMRITSSGSVGIGTASPDIFGFGTAGKYLTVQSNAGGFSLIQVISDGTSGSGINFGNATIRRASIDALNGSHLEFYTNGTNSGTSVSPRMRITSSGNVLIGGTVVQNDSANRGNLTINGTTSILNLSTSNTNAGYLYHGGTDLLLVNAKNGATLFYTNDTERMRITSGGDVYLNNAAALFFGPTSVTYITGSTTNMIFAVNDAERMRITSGGNVGIGTSSPAVALEILRTAGTASYSAMVSGTVDLLVGVDAAGLPRIFTAGANAISMWTNSTERMRITSSGNVLIGTTTDGGYKLDVAGKARVNNSDGFFVQSGSQFRQMYFDGFSTLYFWNGSNQANLSSAGAWVNASDISIKKNIQDLNYSLSDLLSLKPKSYEMKLDNLKQIGFIAQEVEEIIPELVTTDNKGMKGLNYGNLTALLVKAIQEQQEQIQELKNKLL